MYYSLNTIIHFRCIVKGLKTFFAEHPRQVTQNGEVLKAVRLREAESVIRDYFEAMSALGWSRERAVELLLERIKEEF